jgi:hypothetical protein
LFKFIEKEVFVYMFRGVKFLEIKLQVSKHIQSLCDLSRGFSKKAVFLGLLGAMSLTTEMNMPLEADSKTAVVTVEQAEKVGDWMTIVYDDQMKAGQPFSFKVDLHEAKEGLKLVTAIHWFDEKKVYGGLIKNYKAVKIEEAKKGYSKKNTFHFLPEKAGYFVVVSHLSPTGGWKDRTEKFSSTMIPLAS